MARSAYERLLAAETTGPDGIPVTLALQRIQRPGWPTPVLELCWRTRLRPGGPSRRFYMGGGQPWSTEVPVAVSLLSELEERGGLAHDLEPFRPRFETLVSTDLEPSRARTLLREITMPSEDWGSEPLFVVLDEPDHGWRKIMLADPATGRVTFRSTTTSLDYTMRRELRPGTRWHLDNAMQDVHVPGGRIFLDQLRRLDGQRPTSQPSLGRDRQILAERIRSWNEREGEAPTHATSG